MFIKKKPTLHRRTLLRGMIGGSAVAVGLPLLDVFLNDHGTAMADGSGLPRRFGLFFWGNGVIPRRWVPATDGPGWVPSEQLEPLRALRDQVTVISGMGVQVPNDIAHKSGPAGLLTGRPGVRRADTSRFDGPTVDQVIADAVGGDTRFRSLEVGIQRSDEALSFSGVDQPNPPEHSPRALYERVFGAGFRAPGEEGIVDPRLGLRRSVLDVVGEHANRLGTRLGADDRARLDQHFTGIRELELRIQRLEEDPPMLAACTRPEEPLADYPDIEGRPQMDEINAVMSQLVATALACDQTRVFSVQYSRPINNVLFGDATSGHHQLTHDEPGEQPQVHEIVLQIVRSYATLLETLRAIPEGDGTLLDNAVVLGTTDTSLGKSHSIKNYPVLLGGSLCGYLRTGFHYKAFSDENVSKVVLTLLQGMGLFLDEWGREGGRVTSSLGAIES